MRIPWARECLELSQKLYSDDAEENARRYAFLFEKLQPGDVCAGVILSLNGHVATVHLDGAIGKLPVFHLIDPEGKSMHTNPREVGQEISVVISKKEVSFWGVFRKGETFGCAPLMDSQKQPHPFVLFGVRL